MIPKLIHYCWFGGNPLPDEVKRCIDSWKKYCPDYEIREWNESNFDFNSTAYTKEAFEARKWAFITDYVRLLALDQFGGIYMDTDVEVLKNLDAFLAEPGFSCFERENAVQTGLMAAEKGNPFIQELLHEYEGVHFLKEDGTPDLTTNVVRVTDAACRHGLKLNNQKQTVMEFTVYPKEYFCPKNCRTMEIEMTENSHAIHHFDGSWDTDKKKAYRRLMKKTLPPFILKRIVALMDRLGMK